MRKKWTYVAIVSMMLGVAPVFTGCVDTDEPAGLSELRGAKAELLRAKAAVEQARVALVQAKADLKAAEAESKRAYAEWTSQLARKQEIENDFEQAKNELELQKLQAKLDSIQTSLEYWKEEAAVRHEKKMATLNEAAAKAQYAYEVVLKQIEIARALGISDYEQATLSNLEEKVTILYDELYGSEEDQAKGDYGLYGDLRDAEKLLYNAQLNKSMGYETNEDGTPNKGEILWEATLQAEIDIKKAQLEAEKQTLEDLKALADKDVAGTDWAAEIDALAEEIAALEVEVKDLEADLVRGHATPEYLAAHQAVYGVYSEYEPDGITAAPGADLIKSGSKDNLADAKKKRVKASYDSKYAFSFDKFETSTAITRAMSEALLGPGNYSLEGQKLSVAGAKDFVWGNDGDATKLPVEVENALAQYEDHLALFKDKVVDENSIEQAKAELKQAQDAAETKKKAYEDAYADWEEVKNIIAEGKTIQVDVAAFQKLVTDYNTAYGNLETAVDNWNEGLENAYDEAFAVAEGKATLNLKITALGGYNANNAIQEIKAINGFEVDLALEAWHVYDHMPSNQTEAYLTNVILNSSTPATNDGKEMTKAEVAALVEATLKAYVEQETSKMSWDETPFENAGAQAAGLFETTESGKALLKAISDAEKVISGTEGAYAKLSAGVVAFKSLANTFAQQTDDKALNINYLANALDKDGNPVANLGAWVSNATGNESLVGNTPKKAVGNSEVTPEEFEDATTTKFSSTLAQTALDAVSKAAFGEGNRYAPIDIEKAPGGAAKAYNDALKEVAHQEAIISANDDLRAMQTEISTAKNSLKTNMATQYQTVFATILKGIDEAQAAYDTTWAALEKANEPFEELELDIAETKAQLAGKKSVSNTLTEFVDKYLEDAVLEDGTSVKYDPETFAVKMLEAVAVQEKEVADAEQDLKEAEVALQKAQAGEFDSVDYYTMVRDFAKARFDAKMEEYTKAQENVAKALEIMSGTTDSEQPAE